MHILTTSTDAQTLQIIPRRVNQGQVTVILYNKSENRDVDYASAYFWQTTNLFFNEVDENWNDDPILDFTYGDIFSTVSGKFNLTENQYYGIKLIDDTGELYKGLIFCTNQTNYNKFDVHKDDYVVEDSYDNEYVIL